MRAIFILILVFFSLPLLGEPVGEPGETDLSPRQQAFLHDVNKLTPEEQELLVQRLAEAAAEQRDKLANLLKKTPIELFSQPPRSLNDFAYVAVKRRVDPGLLTREENKVAIYRERPLLWAGALTSWNILNTADAVGGLAEGLAPIGILGGLGSGILLTGLELSMTFFRLKQIVRLDTEKKLWEIEHKQADLKGTLHKLAALKANPELRPWVELWEEEKGPFSVDADQENSIRVRRNNFDETSVSTCRATFETLYLGPRTIKGWFYATAGVAAAVAPLKYNQNLRSFVSTQLEDWNLKKPQPQTPWGYRGPGHP